MGLGTWHLLVQKAASAQPGRQNRLARFARILDVHQRCFGLLPRVVKVTGTVGKGSVCAMLEAMLVRDGRNVCTFTSPHLVSARERIRINGRMLPEDVWNAAADEVQSFLIKVDKLLGRVCQPSFFETLLLMALHLCRTNATEVAIVEAGVGGYNDVVSLLNGPIAAITAIGFDHNEELGATLPDIAADKVGIASAGSTLILGPYLPKEALSAVLQDAVKRNVRVRYADRGRIRAESCHSSGFEVELQGLTFTLPLSGTFQLNNLATAICLFETLLDLGWASEWRSIVGAENTDWPARLETVKGSPDCLLDAAHNSLAFQELKKHIETRYPDSRVALVFGVSEKAKASEGLDILSLVASRIFFTSGFYRSAINRAEDLSLQGEIAEKTEFFPSPSQARDVLRDQHQQFDLAVVTGSIFLVGAWKALPAG